MLDDLSDEHSLHGRRFSAVRNTPGGQVTEETQFEFRQEDDLIYARYRGGAVRLGFLVGSRQGMRARIRYVHIDREGTMRSGRSEERLEVLPGGRLRIHEQWEWTSEPGEGTSVLEEM
jgi:hypothetical protein